MKHMQPTLRLNVFVIFSLLLLVVFGLAPVGGIRELSHTESQKVIGSKGEWGLIIADHICLSSSCPTTTVPCETPDGCSWSAAFQSHQGGSECTSFPLGSLHLCQETLGRNTCGFFFLCEWDEEAEACLAAVVTIIWTPKDCVSL